MKIKNKTKKFFFPSFIIGLFFGGFLLVLGLIGSKNIALAADATTPTQFNYTLLESFPGFYQAGKTMTDFPALILAIYKFGIWTVGIAGFFMLVVGGFMYMASVGNTSTASNARGIIADALLGIVAALGAYLILYVINPDLTKINIGFTTVNVEKDDLGGTSENDSGNKSTSGGCIKPVDQARKAKAAGWIYNQDLRGKTMNGVRYTDCSNLVESSYLAGGCSSPGGDTSSQYSHAVSFSNVGQLKAGDVLVHPGHSVMCMNDGCGQIIEASGKGKPLFIKGGGYFNNKSGEWTDAKVIKAINYCGSC